MGFFDKINEGLHRSRTRLKEQMNILLDRGPDVDDDFWDDLEETLILADIGAAAADSIIEELRDQAKRKALPDAYAVFDMLTDQMAATFTEAETDIFEENPSLVLFVGINGAGKTTTVGKLAASYHEKGRKVLLGSADTFRAAAIEQLEVWAKRADVTIVSRERGSDPASVCYETIERAEKDGSDMVSSTLRDVFIHPMTLCVSCKRLSTLCANAQTFLYTQCLSSMPQLGRMAFSRLRSSTMRLIWMASS